MQNPCEKGRQSLAQPKIVALKCPMSVLYWGRQRVFALLCYFVVFMFASNPSVTKHLKEYVLRPWMFSSSAKSAYIPAHLLFSFSPLGPFVSSGSSMAVQVTGWRASTVIFIVPTLLWWLPVPTRWLGLRAEFSCTKSCQIFRWKSDSARDCYIQNEREELRLHAHFVLYVPGLLSTPLSILHCFLFTHPSFHTSSFHTPFFSFIEQLEKV